jgi:hypothetical protein
MVDIGRKGASFRALGSHGYVIYSRALMRVYRSKEGSVMKSENNPANTQPAGLRAEAVARKVTARHRVEREREQFRALILANPNYFGNVKESPFKPAKVILSNTTYEEAKCVGFNPQFDRLEAVVLVKQESGYGGDVCSNGTPEYVRFYVSFDDGTTWEDQGMVSFTAYDIPGAKPLEYDVTLEIDPPKEWCLVENLAKVRAILSWNNPPPPDDPDHPPVWGNVAEAYIQIDTGKFVVVADIFEHLEFKIPENLAAVLDLAEPLAAAKPKELSVTELAALYKGKDVPEHRFLFSELQKVIAKPELSESLMAPGFPGFLTELDIDFTKVVNKLQQTDGDTRYEELKCVGLNPDQDSLVGVLTVKLSSGYSGELCSPGSQEYVAFWVDWGDGAGWTYAGTSSVNVHDISSIPPGGLQYAVFLPADLTSRRQRCEQGAKTAKVRAILSWQVPPPPGNPNYVPTWGNREETLIHIYPGTVVPPGDYKPFIYGVSGAGACSIDQTNGFATGDKPFGARIYVTGEIPAALGLATPDTLKYKVKVRPLSPPGAWQPLSNSFSVHITEGTGLGTAIGYTLVQEIDPGDGYYTYREHGSPVLGAWRRVTSPNRLLALWNTTPAETGLWEIKVEALDITTDVTYAAGITTCVADGSTRQNIKVRLDQVRPTPKIKITGFSRGGGPVEPAVECETFQKGDVIHGTYSVTDEHFRLLSFTVEVDAHAHGATVSPSTRKYGSPDFVPTTGETGTWSLNTGPMDPCGYVVRLEVWDRTIVSGYHAGWKNEEFVGFSLEAAP